MTHKLDITEAARVLHQHRLAATKLIALSSDLRPRDRAEGYAIQAALASHSAHPLFGWKIAATSEAGQKHINVTGPMAGRILAETVLPNGGTASMRGNQMWVGEPEFAFRIGHDLPPRSEPYGVAEVLAAVDTLHPAIEIPDSRFADFVNAGEAQLIADNACANLFVLGPPVANDWRARDLVEERPTISPIYRPWPERARRSPRGSRLAGQRIARARPDAENGRGRNHGNLPRAAADPVRRRTGDGFRRYGTSLGEVCLRSALVVRKSQSRSGHGCQPVIEALDVGRVNADFTTAIELGEQRRV